ncbi:MAG: hypothetical protein ACOCUW_04770, partial [Gemmatimonadota bacterium]
MADSGRAVSGVLFVVLGLLGAFLVSAVAGIRDDEPAPTGFRLFGPGEEARRETRVEVLNGAGTAG